MYYDKIPIYPIFYLRGTIGVYNGYIGVIYGLRKMMTPGMNNHIGKKRWPNMEWKLQSGLDGLLSWEVELNNYQNHFEV